MTPNDVGDIAARSDYHTNIVFGPRGLMATRAYVWPNAFYVVVMGIVPSGSRAGPWQINDIKVFRLPPMPANRAKEPAIYSYINELSKALVSDREPSGELIYADPPQN